MRHWIYALSLLLFILIFAACTQNATPVERVIPSGFIEGQVKIEEPSAKSMYVYAVDQKTNAWYSMEIIDWENSASFDFDVAPGDYLLFAVSEAGAWGGYSEDGVVLSPVDVLSGQLKSEITIQPPQQLDCGPFFGLPASPDGRFQQIPGATKECLATLENTTGSISGQIYTEEQLDLSMVVYAVDEQNEAWFSLETHEVEDGGNFRFDVPPGDYLLFAFSESGAWSGYSETGRSLTPITVQNGQTLTDIELRSVISPECGAYIDIPASPDGRFDKIVGADPNCLNRLAMEMQ